MFLPELVKNIESPEETDSLGNIIRESIHYKSLNYTGITSINTQAIIELNEKVDKRTLSDGSLKTDIIDLDNSLGKIKAMRGVKHQWDYTNHPEMAFDSAVHIGFIAQEIHAVDPDLTFRDAANLMHVDYDKVVPIIVESIKEIDFKTNKKDSIILVQQNQIDDLNTRLTQLENCLSALLPTLCQGEFYNLIL
jgi:hypothetical protein